MRGSPDSLKLVKRSRGTGKSSCHWSDSGLLGKLQSGNYWDIGGKFTLLHRKTVIWGFKFMALVVPSLECGRERVSDTAEACPDCGYKCKY